MLDRLAPGTPEFQATLVYMDRAGTTSSSLHRINDLSLRVTDPNGTAYWGNRGLNGSGLQLQPVRRCASNTKDPVEHVILENPIAGNWTVEVIADEVNQDTHSGDRRGRRRLRFGCARHDGWIGWLPGRHRVRHLWWPNDLRGQWRDPWRRRCVDLRRARQPRARWPGLPGCDL